MFKQVQIQPADWIGLYYTKMIVHMPKYVLWSANAPGVYMTFQLLFWSSKSMVRPYANGPEGPSASDVELLVIGLVVGRSNPVLRLCLTGGRCSITASPSASCYPQNATVWRLQGSSLIWSQHSSYKVGGDRSDQMLLAYLAVVHPSTKFKSALSAWEPKREQWCHSLSCEWFRVRHDLSFSVFKAEARAYQQTV